MPSYTINEPHPTFAAGTYTHSGRGGAGNTFQVSSTAAESQPLAASKTATAAPTRFYSGRGGAGNAHKAVPKPLLSFDEEYERAVAQDTVSVGHVGRGGAGNVYGLSDKKTSEAGGSSRRSSGEDNHSMRSGGFWARISGASVNNH